MWNSQFSLHRIFRVHSGNRVVVIIKQYMKILNLEAKPFCNARLNTDLRGHFARNKPKTLSKNGVIFGRAGRIWTCDAPVSACTPDRLK